LNSTVQAIPLVTLIGVSRKHPALIVNSIELVHRRAQDLRRQVRRINTQESEVVIGRALYELADEAPDGRRVLSKRVTQAELASYVGMSREQVNKKMRELEAKGLIRRTDDGYELDPAFSQTNILAERT
jgi:CRP-like cAMP-binding protein